MLPLGAEGGRVLLALLAAEKSTLGTRRVEKFAQDGSEVVVIPYEQVGEGASVFAYKARYGARIVLVKEFKEHAESAKNSELRYLTKLKALARDWRVPELIGLNENLLVLFPVATPLHRIPAALDGAAYVWCCVQNFMQATSLLCS